MCCMENPGCHITNSFIKWTCITSGFAHGTALGFRTNHWQQGVYVTVSEGIASETLCCLGTEGPWLTFLSPHSNFQIPYFSVD